MHYHFDLVKKEYYESIYEYRRQLLDTQSMTDGCSDLEKYEDIEKWDLNNRLFEKEETVPPGYSIGFEYVYLDENNNVVGMVNLRPKADEHPYLKKYGGHIGYNIRPDKRGLGIGKQMLKDFLPICKSEYGLNKIMISCMEYNDASRKVIISNGGEFETSVLYPSEGKMLERYWFSL